MRNWFCLRVLRKIRPAVTGRTLPCQPGMTHYRGRPGNKTARVATVALRDSRNVIDCLGLCVGEDISTAVTGGTCSGDSRMAHARRPERREIGMAGVTLGGRWNMRGRLAECRCPVMACGTRTGGTWTMGVSGGCPGQRRAMAGIALGCRADVGNRFDLGVLGKIGAAVTRRAEPAQATVIHGCRAPADGSTHVTGVALGVARDVIDWPRLRVGKKVCPVVAT